MQHDYRVFAARKQQYRALKLGSHFADDRYRLIYQATQRRLHDGSG
jgi:hypothetical protein